MKTRTTVGTKRPLLCAALCFLVAASFAQVGVDGSKGTAGEASPEMAALQTAYSLARYGYANESASALIGAAEILAQTPTQPMGAAAEQGAPGAGSGKKTAKPEFTAANLLSDGKKYAAGDKTMLAWAAEVEKSLAVTTRGALGGPRYQVDRVSADTYNRYLLTFRAGQTAEISVSGDGDTDLDLYIYDANDNLIVYDEGWSDDCYVRWTPKWTGGFTIYVVNRGDVYNQFEIATN